MCGLVGATATNRSAPVIPTSPATPILLPAAPALSTLAPTSSAARLTAPEGCAVAPLPCPVPAPIATPAPTLHSPLVAVAPPAVRSPAANALSVDQHFYEDG